MRLLNATKSSLPYPFAYSSCNLLSVPFGGCERELCAQRRSGAEQILPDTLFSYGIKRVHPTTLQLFV